MTVLRNALVAVVVVATAAFVVGTAIERNSSGESGHHGEAAATTTGEAHSEAGEGRSTAKAEEPHAELRPLGVDVEAWPFVALAAAVSLTLAAAAWLRPRASPLLALVAMAMLAFAALDAREVVHQLDIDESALALLAAAIAALHAVAAVAAGAMASRARTLPA